MNLGMRSDTVKGGRYRRLLVCLRARQIWREKGQRLGYVIEDWSQAEDEYENQHCALIARINFNVPEQLLGSLDLYLKFLILPITLIAGIVALLNYMETINQDKLKISLSYADRYEQESFMHIRDILIEFLGGKVMLQAKPNNFDEKVNSFVEAGDHKKLIMRQYYLFDELSFCSNAGLCNREFLCGRFAGDIGAFRNSVLAYFADLSYSWQECLTSVIDNFLSSCGGIKLRSWPNSGMAIQCK